MARPAAGRQLARFHPFELGPQQPRRPRQALAVVGGPVAPVEQGPAARPQQRHQVFGHHRRARHGAGQGQVEAPPAGGVAAAALDPLVAQPDAVGEPELRRHRRHGLELPAHRVHQGQAGVGQRDRHRQAGESPAGADIDHAQAGPLGRSPWLRPPQQRPEAVEHLGDPVVVVLHQAGEVDPGVPAAQEVLEPPQPRQLVGGGGPAQGLPEGGVGPGRRVGHPWRRRTSSLGSPPSAQGSAIPTHDGPTHYDLLGLAAGASAEDLRRSFRRLSKRYHPDTTTLPPEQAQEAFRRLRHAYAVLSDPEARRAYDAQLRRASLPQPTPLPPRPPVAPRPRPTSVRRALSGGEWFALLLLALALLLSLVLGIGVAWARGKELIQRPSWWGDLAQAGAQPGRAVAESTASLPAASLPAAPRPAAPVPPGAERPVAEPPGDVPPGAPPPEPAAADVPLAAA